MCAADSFSVREATNVDCAAIWALISGVLKEYAFAPDRTTTDRDLTDIEASYTNAGGVFFVLLDASSIIGTVALCRESDACCELCRMYLAANYRRRGLGRLLFDTATKEAVRRGFREMRLETAAVLVEAIALYKSAGFAIVKGKPSGKNCNLIMSKPLL